MDGLSRVAGAGPVVDLDGNQVTLQGDVLQHYAEMEAEIIKRRGNPFDMVRNAKDAFKDDPALMQQFVSQAFEEAKKWRFVEALDVYEWMYRTIPGFLMVLWLRVRHNDPQKFTLDAVSGMYFRHYERLLKTEGLEAAQKWKASLEDAVEQAAGEDELGNSTGSPSSAASGETTDASPGS